MLGRFSGGVRQGRQSSEWLKFGFQTASSRTLINTAGETAQTAAESPYTVNSIGMLARMAAHGLGVAVGTGDDGGKIRSRRPSETVAADENEVFYRVFARQDGEGYGKGRLKPIFRRPLPLKAWWNQCETETKRQADAAIRYAMISPNMPTSRLCCLPRFSALLPPGCRFRRRWRA